MRKGIVRKRRREKEKSVHLVTSNGLNKTVAYVFKRANRRISFISSKQYPRKFIFVGLEVRIIETETPNCGLTANPTKTREMTTKGKRSCGTRRRGKRRSNQGVTNSRPGARTLGTCGGNDENLMVETT